MSRSLTVLQTDVYYVTNVPEPATWAQMILGFGLIGGAIRRIQVRKVEFAAA